MFTFGRKGMLFDLSHPKNPTSGPGAAANYRVKVLTFNRKGY